MGDVFHLVATVEPADASVKKLEWTSSDPTVAKVYVMEMLRLSE